MARLHPHIQEVMREMGEDDPVRAVRAKAAALVHDFARSFDIGPPFDLEALASFRGLVISTNAPRHSEDSEIAPVNGRVELRVNRDRPLVRQRFSIGHELGHTLFPDYHLAVHCRKPADRDWADPSDQIEVLCDVAASEILFPSPWFERAATNMPHTATGILGLAATFMASSEATIRRLVEVLPGPVAAVFCSWRLKPTESRQVARDRHQSRIFDGMLDPVPTLRVDYSIANEQFRACCTDHVPQHKSLPVEGAIGQAAMNQEPSDGVMWLDLGTCQGVFHVHALPVYTPPELIGPGGAVSVVCVLQPNPGRGPLGAERPSRYRPKA